MRSGLRLSVPLVDLTRLDDELLSELDAVFAQISRTGAFTLGDELAAFESDFAAYCGTGECVGVSDGTEAIRLALVALGVRPGDEVITVPHTFVATIEAIAMTGARPVLVDIDPFTRCIDPERVAAAVTPRTAAVVAVHLYGRVAPMAEVVEAARGVPVVEDAAQAHGATLAGRRAGSIGAAGCFSFYPTKNLGALGDGGAVTCDDPELAATVRSLRHHGSEPGDANRHVRLGSTARLDNLQAALLRPKLRALDAWNEQRREAARRYRETLAGLPLTLPPDDPPDGRQVFHLFALELEERDRVLAGLRERGVEAAVHYPTPAHLQPAWEHLGYREGDLPHSEAAARRTLTLPIFPGITYEEIDYVADSLAQALS